MLSLDLASLLLAPIVVIIGWIAVHQFNLRRDRTLKKRDLQIQYLIEAYRRIERAANRPKDFDNHLELESAIADIQLFGSSEQVELAQKFAFDIGDKANASTDSLLINLREELRKELQLPKVAPEIVYLRIDKEQLPLK